MGGGFFAALSVLAAFILSVVLASSCGGFYSAPTHFAVGGCCCLFLAKSPNALLLPRRNGCFSSAVNDTDTKITMLVRRQEKGGEEGHGTAAAENSPSDLGFTIVVYKEIANTGRGYSNNSDGHAQAHTHTHARYNSGMVMGIHQFTRCIHAHAERQSTRQ